jgi:hypothetical protein
VAVAGTAPSRRQGSAGLADGSTARSFHLPGNKRKEKSGSGSGESYRVRTCGANMRPQDRDVSCV